MEPFDFINRANADYIDQLHEQYRNDPRLVPETWRAFFAGFEIGLRRSELTPQTSAGEYVTPPAIGVFDLVHTYRELGHFVANLDPLGHNRDNHPLLELNNFGLTEADLDRQVGQGSFLGQTDGTLRDLILKLRETYCSNLGVEYINISDKAQREWLQQRMEPVLNKPQLNEVEKHELLYQLTAAEEFELFLGRTYKGAKRFGLEGGESFVPLVNALVDQGALLGGEQFIMSMAHRGRLNTLAHVINKPYANIISEFEKSTGNSREESHEDEYTGDGDVKYHLGYANQRRVDDEHTVKVSLVPNPSHLELINPIMQGITRCKQQIFGDRGRVRVVPIQVHGDASFTGQGVVTETLCLSELPGFATGGTIHVIINNQIGFTTPPKQGRFTPYPTDLAKAIQAPIFHVNGDDPEAVVWAARLAIGFRQQFRCDVMIDLWCYRRNGHNEVDEPNFTQPVMYREIGKHLSVRRIYEARLLAEGFETEETLARKKEAALRRLELAKQHAIEVKPKQKLPSFGGVWQGLGRAADDWTAKTAIGKDVAAKVMQAYAAVPANFTMNPKVERLVVHERLKMLEAGKGFDWGTAEMLAFGSLLLEGHSIRLTGQDVERGTFSHRHAVFFDFNTGDPHYPLARLNKDASFTIINSMLSEFAVLGFEWGYASADPRNLVLWEAQFGDFVNGAQPIIDQIIAAAESKWRYMNGLVMLLPHGYEGQGPEHSNAYLERFLSLCAEDNMQVCVLSTPAQYFHALRRQIHRKFRKPLVLMQPKSLLRAKESKLEDFTQGSFQTVIDDAHVAEPDKVKKVLLCCGKVYYPIRDAREKATGSREVAIVRVEQLYPFPERELEAVLDRYGRVQEICWVQEEPQNRGAWRFIEPHLRAMFPDSLISYIGREAAASPATGSINDHNKEEAEIVATALELSPTSQTVQAVTAPGTAATATSGTPVSG